MCIRSISIYSHHNCCLLIRFEEGPQPMYADDRRGGRRGRFPRGGAARWSSERQPFSQNGESFIFLWKRNKKSWCTMKDLFAGLDRLSVYSSLHEIIIGDKLQWLINQLITLLHNHHRCCCCLAQMIRVTDELRLIGRTPWPVRTKRVRGSGEGEEAAAVVSEEVGALFGMSSSVVANFYQTELNFVADSRGRGGMMETRKRVNDEEDTVLDGRRDASENASPERGRCLHLQWLVFYHLPLFINLAI